MAFKLQISSIRAWFEYDDDTIVVPLDVWGGMFINAHPAEGVPAPAVATASATTGGITIEDATEPDEIHYPPT